MENHPENIDTIACPSCGEGNEMGNQFCVHCGNPLPTRKETRFKNRSILFGAVSLILMGTIVFFWMGGFEPKLVGKVNGEEITRKEYLMRLDRAKKIYESRYGRGLFEGETGKENLNRLKTDIIDEMIVEKILLQEAKRAGYTSAPEEEIGKQLEAIKKRFALSDADLKKKMGGSIENFKEELRKGWMISQFVEKTILKDSRGNPNLLFGQWLLKAKAKAKIETYEKLEPIVTAKASCCRSGCGGGRVQPLDPKVEKEAKAKALEYYEKKTQKKGAEAKVTNFGCHIQIDIIEDNKIVVSLTYNGREIQEI
ncbi:MAG: SurA N-terminal domain-containing protein [Thermodesulfobacteriota bacterium]